MVHDLSHDKPGGSGADAPVTTGQLARQQAIQQIERRRRFWFRATAGTVGMIVLATIWAIAEYSNAGGWPTGGFSQSSGIPNVWNYWIIYPAIAWVLLTAADAWWVFGRRPISEEQIKHEMEREAGQR
jgi:2TM domain